MHFLIFLIFGCASFAAEFPLLLRTAETKLLSCRTLKTSFTVTIIWEMKDTTETKRGSLSIKGKDKYRVEIGDALFVSDGKAMFRYSPGLNQLVIQESSSLTNEFQPSSFFFSYSGRFNISGERQEVIGGIKCITYELSPKAKDRFRSMEVAVSVIDSLPKRILTIDHNGNKAQYVMNNIVLDDKVSDRLFTVKPPKGTEVIDLRDSDGQ